MENHQKLWNKLTFKTTSYRKNFDLSFENENFITEHDGTISEVRINQNKPPFQVGEFQFSTWNFGFAKEFNVNLTDYLEEHYFEDTYNELIKLIKNNKISLNNINKLVLLHTFILHPDYRKMGVTEEFIEFIYRDFIYGNNNLLIALIKPIQENPIDFDFFWNKRIVNMKKSVGKDVPYIEMNARNYYKLNKLVEDYDNEMTKYKLFAVAKRCGFERIDESHLFSLNTNYVIDRLKNKRKTMSNFNF
jgi:hypothetical protein